MLLIVLDICAPVHLQAVTQLIPPLFPVALAATQTIVILVLLLPQLLPMLLLLKIRWQYLAT